MVITEAAPQTSSIVVVNARALELTDEQFFQLCQDNRELSLEMTSDRKLLIMSPTGSETGRKNSELNYQLRHWTKQDSSGECFDSSTGFTLPNGAKRSPDASWIRKERYAALSEEDREGFAPICPDFVIELRSQNDSLNTLQEKMREYIENGAQLGWLIDPSERKVYVYRPNQKTECLAEPEIVSGEPLLSKFTLEMREIW